MNGPPAPPALTELPVPGLERVFLFSLGSVPLAVHGHLVQGVVPIQHVLPVPRAPEAVLGVAHHLGNVLPILDVRSEVGVAGEREPGPFLALLLQVSAWSVGIVIDEVRGYEALLVEPVPASRQRDAPATRHTVGTLEYSGERFSVLDVEALLGAVRNS